MSPDWPLIFGLCIGVGLSAASGMRLFIPPLVLSTAALYFGMPLPDSLHWLATPTAFYIFLTATVVEIGAYYIPWLDNLLDSIAAPAAVVAGTLITSPFLGDIDPFWRWTLALLAGGTAAGTVQTLTTTARLSSLAATAGLANPIVATLENLFALAITVTTVVFPVITIVFLLVALLAAVWVVRKFRRA